MTRKETITFYNIHSRRLFNMSYRILLNAEDAEEVMQDTIIKFVMVPRPRMEPQQVSAWLARTCIRASIDRLRRQQRERKLLEEYAFEQRESSTEDTPAEEEFAAVPAETILSAISRLEDPYRLVVTLVLVEGLDYGEIAEYTGWKETTLRSHFARGKKKLSALIEEGK